MAWFLAERYQPEPLDSEAITALADNERTAARAMSIGHISTIYVPDDETSFTLFEAPSRERVLETSDRFGLGYSRVVSAIAVCSAEPRDPP